MSKKLELSKDEWSALTYIKNWLDQYEEGDIIKVYHPNGKVFRYKVVTRKILESI